MDHHGWWIDSRVAINARRNILLGTTDFHQLAWITVVIRGFVAAIKALPEFLLEHRSIFGIQLRERTKLWAACGMRRAAQDASSVHHMRGVCHRGSAGHDVDQGVCVPHIEPCNVDVHTEIRVPMENAFKLQISVLGTLGPPELELVDEHISDWRDDFVRDGEQRITR